ncbi:MAG: hypothetical protein RSB59_03565, partial [Clostridia bacterium]
LNDDKVLSVNFANSDAEVLLAETNLVGLQLEEAAEKVVSLSVEEGYIDVDTKSGDVKVAVVNGDEQKKVKIENNLEMRLNRYFDNNGIFGKVSIETLAEYGSQAAALGVSTGHMKMILKAIELNPELTVEQLSAMPTNEIVQLINKCHKGENLCKAIQQQLNIDKEALKIKFAELFTLENEVDAIKVQLKNFAGTAEEKAILENDLALKVARIAILKPQYESELKALIDKAKADTNLMREQNKEQKRQRIEQNKSKMEAHRNRFRNNENKIKNDIKNWRNG